MDKEILKIYQYCKDLKGHKDEICQMTYKTFLKLFEKDYSLFKLYGKTWYFKDTDIEIQLLYTNNVMPDDYIIFMNKEVFDFGNL